MPSKRLIFGWLVAMAAAVAIGCSGLLLLAGNSLAQDIGGGAVNNPTQPTTNASDLTSGTLPDARLSANVPLLDAANVFTADITANAGGQGLVVGPGSVDHAYIGIFGDTASPSTRYGYLGVSGAGSTSIDLVSEVGQLTLIGTGEIQLDAATLDFNGAADFSGSVLTSQGGGQVFGWSDDSNTYIASPVADSIQLVTGASAVATFAAAEVDLTATALTVNSIDLTPASGTFTASFDTACTTTPTATFDYQRIGNVVVLSMTAVAGFPCTGDSTSFGTTGTPVPAALRPAITVFAGEHAGFVDNATSSSARLNVLSSGVLSFTRTAAGGTTSWTASGNRSINSAGMQFVYMLGDP